MNKYLYNFINRTFLAKTVNKAFIAKFRQQFLEFESKSKTLPPRFILRWEDRNPILSDETASHGFDRHYIYHTAWAMRKVREINPQFHVDFSSSLYFCSLLSAFVQTRFYDFRVPNLELESLSVDSADLTRLSIDDASLPSVSCMHVVEHIGLGRYGDTIDPVGDLKAMHELKRIVAPGGSLLFVAPVGQAKVEFNAQRIYSFEHIVEAFSGMQLKEFSLVPDNKKQGLIISADPEMVKLQSYGCGCFWFIRPTCNGERSIKSVSK